MDDTPRVLGAPDAVVDEATQRLIERAAEDAYARGCQDGAAQAVHAAEAAAANVLSALGTLDGELREIAAAADTSLALEIAAAVLEQQPCDAVRALLARIEGVLSALDDDPLVVRANPADIEGLRPGLDDPRITQGVAVDLIADADVPRGEALVAGRWSRADLTRRGAWEAVAAELAAEART